MIVLIIGFIFVSVWANQLKAKTDTSGELARSQNINISDLLDEILLGYDNHIRPDFGGPPTEVFIDFHVRSMGPISEIDMTYVMDCYFRQTWTDKRLSYKTRNLMEMNGNQTLSAPALALSIYMLDRIWKPPTYFLNSRQSHMHVITLPNKFVRIYSDGKVLYSSRMTITANCPMNLENFPMDTQRCPLALGSFGYSMAEVIYSWNPARKVVINPDMKMSQFDLISVPVGNKSNDERKDGPYSILLASFHFQRHMGSFVIEVYAPCIMLVVLSWVSFWINREATADRVTLGLTTVLTMTFLGLELRNDLPKVPYLTALDYFVYISFAFISATILEFGFVHYFTKIGSGEYYFSAGPFMQIDRSHEIDDNYSSDDIDNEDDEYEEYEDYKDGAHSVRTVRTSDGHRPEINGKNRYDIRDETIDNDYFGKVRDPHKDSSIIFPREQREIYSTSRDRGVGLKQDELTDAGVASSSSSQISAQIEHYDYDYDIQEPTTSTSSMRCRAHRQSLPSTTTRRESRDTKHMTGDTDGRQTSRLSSIRASIRRTLSGKKSRRSCRRPSLSTIQLNSVSKIDTISRVIFPLAFIIMNLVYWYIFLRAEMKFDQMNKFI